MKINQIENAKLELLAQGRYRFTGPVVELLVEASDVPVVLPPAPNPPTTPPPTTPPPPTQPPAAGLMTVGPNNMPNKNVIAPVDTIDGKDIPAPIPFTGTIPPGQNGVEPKDGKWRKIPLCGNPPWLYEQTPYVVDGAIERVTGQLGDDIALNAMPALRGDKGVKKYPLRGGPRGIAIATPYTAWHGHSPVRNDGTVATDVRVPLYLGLTPHGVLMDVRTDGSINHLMQLPLPNGGFYNDFALYEPRESNLFYAVNGPLGQIVEVDRHQAPPTVRVVSAGHGRLTSIRQVGAWLYACNPDAGRILRFDPLSGVVQQVADVPRVFWIDHDSKGNLVVVTLNRTVHRVTPDGKVSADLLGRAGNLDQKTGWVNVSVDRNGTCGEVDSILSLSTHGVANVDVFRITSKGVNAGGFSQGGGRSTVGRLSGVGEALGHYPWNAEFHPFYGLILVQGFAECIPGFVCPEAEGQKYWADEDSQSEGITVDGKLMERGQALGTGRDLLFQEFSQQMTPRGGGLVTADHIAAMSYADAVAFLRAGMLSKRPRTFTKGQLMCMLYCLYRQSQRFMREGRALVDGLIAYCQALP